MYRSFSVVKVSNALDLDPELLEFPQPAPIPTDRPELPQQIQLPLYKVKNLNYERSLIKENDLFNKTTGLNQATERLSSVLDEWNAMKETINTSRSNSRRFVRRPNDENASKIPTISSSKSATALRPSNISPSSITRTPLQVSNKPTKRNIPKEDGLKIKLHRR